MTLVYAIIGTRPQLIKHAALELALKDQFILKTIHTGQHYDENMDSIFFKELSINSPTFQLHVGSEPPVSQTAKMMVGIENICLDKKPDLILVYGDTNSTLAGALVASKLNIPLAHVEAGMRSHNLKMPEEINRILTDRVSNLFFVSSSKAIGNLEKEGITENICLVGDLMKDLLIQAKKNAWIQNLPSDKDFYYASIHRPYNTDEPSRLKYILNHLQYLSLPVFFSCHPRTREAMREFDIQKEDYDNINFIVPQSYLKNLSFIHSAKALITDSGGMQKEAYWLQKKCITVRSETEWVETLDSNANVLVFENLDKIEYLFSQEAKWDESLYGDGLAGKKICDEIGLYLKSKKERILKCNNSFDN